ncbi:hypothetical protein SAMN00777080_1390 [Aquiflexum balticum DSM 16537]|uniref:Uncharacterized protein n=1 Tax=Aquiflexum balticum DSM 16537 TaxID=758820 RepID=A0A1W2H1K6_9BACT|nr:hypothetical protein [Aquiflexum balticum]SMD42825.1 hypothetical protein SAMN00777080_1390 [Aquiflexum balticum DSM 16537]
MATITQRITEAKKIYKIYWDSYTKGDLETFASTWLRETEEGKGSEFIFQIPINTDNR